MDRAEKSDKEEKDAEQLFLTGNPENAGIVEIIKRVNKLEQLPVFYSGGFRVLKSLILTSELFYNFCSCNNICTLGFLKSLSIRPEAIFKQQNPCTNSEIHVSVEHDFYTPRKTKFKGGILFSACP